MSTADEVNSPQHYTSYRNIEIIQLTEQMGFLEGNIIKYVARAPFKGSEITDLKKARWYLDRLIHNRESDTLDSPTDNQENA